MSGPVPAAQRARPHRSLSGMLADRGSAIARYLAERFPDTRALVRGYREASCPLRVARGTADPGLIGSSFDLALRLLLVPQADVSVALRALTPRRGLAETAKLLQELAGRESWLCDRDRDRLIRLAWALGLGVTLYRTGRAPEGFPLLTLAGRMPTEEDVLGIVPEDARVELGALIELAAAAPVAHVAAQADRRLSGPTFSGSAFINADADLILDDLLIDTKTSQGSRRADGSWCSNTTQRELHQLVAYFLLDFDDAYGLRRIGFYAGRYGQLQVWAVEDVLEMMSGASRVDIPAERERFRHLVTTQQTDRPTPDEAREQLIERLSRLDQQLSNEQQSAGALPTSGRRHLGKLLAELKGRQQTP